MGVKDLWQLLAPIGRRISIETLEGKVLAIDASVWIIQFIKAMREDDGKMMKNAHILGTLRRILKLLFHKIKPVFVFDGETPELKRRTVKERKKQREKSENSQRVTAQRILLSQIKQQALKEKLAAAGKLLAATKEQGQYSDSFMPYPSAHAKTSEEEAIVPAVGKEDDTTAVFEVKDEDEDEDVAWNRGETSTATPVEISRSLAREDSSKNKAGAEDWDDDVLWEEGYENLRSKADTNGDNDGEGDGDESDEEFHWELPQNDAELDVGVLASLPFHMRKDLIEEARKRDRVRRRSRYLPVAADPLMYSQTQLSNFLNGSKLNQRIVEAQKRVDGDDEKGGKFGKRIAAQGNKKYVMLSAGTNPENGEDDAGVAAGATSVQQRKEYIQKLRDLGYDIGDDYSDEEDSGGEGADGSKLRAEDYGDSISMIKKDNMKPVIMVDGDDAADEDAWMQDVDLHEQEALAESAKSLSSSASLPVSVSVSVSSASSSVNRMPNGRSSKTAVASAGSATASGLSSVSSILKKLNQTSESSVQNARLNPMKSSSSSIVVKGNESKRRRVTIATSDDENSVDGQNNSSVGVAQAEDVSAMRRITSEDEGDETGSVEWETSDPQEDLAVNESGDEGDIASQIPVHDVTNATNVEIVDIAGQSDGDDEDKDEISSEDDESSAGGGGFIVENGETSESGPGKPADIFTDAKQQNDPPSPDRKDGPPFPAPASNGAFISHISFNRNLHERHAEISKTDSAPTDLEEPIQSSTKQESHQSASGNSSKCIMKAGDEKIDVECKKTEEVTVESSFYINLHAGGGEGSDDDVDWEQETVDDRPAQKSDVSKEDDTASNSEVAFVGGDGSSNSSALGADDMEIYRSGTSAIDDEPLSPLGAGAAGFASPPSPSRPGDLAGTGREERRGVSADMASRAVSMANRMGDWAGRAVRRVLQQQLSADAVASATSAAPENATAVTAPPPPKIIQPSSASASTSAAEYLKILSSPAAADIDEDPENNVIDVTDDTCESESAFPACEDVTAAKQEIEKVERSSHVTFADAVEIHDDRGAHTPTVVAEAVTSSPSEVDIEGALREEEELEAEVRRHRLASMRDAEQMTQEMRDEVIQLLNVFGLPYMVAPYEAEAQCAVLEQLSVVDGVVTEDSDAFPFGAKTVYRNIFNDKKYVEVYRADDASREIGLDQEDFVSLAFFLGSDYTEGISGIGIVNALEIIQAFPMKIASGGPINGLKSFRSWLESYSIEDTVKSLVDSQKKKEVKKGKKGKKATAVRRARKRKKVRLPTKSSRATKRRPNAGNGTLDKDGDNEKDDVDDDNDDDDDDDEFVSDADEPSDEENSDDAATMDDDDDGDGFDINAEGEEDQAEQRLMDFSKKHQSGRANWKVPGNFPDARVVDAYLQPKASRDEAAFEWPAPKLHRVRKFCAELLGWTEQQMDAQVDPVIRRFADKSIQPRIDSHFMSYKDDRRFAKVSSSRLRDAVVQITGKSTSLSLQKEKAAKARAAPGKGKAAKGKAKGGKKMTSADSALLMSKMKDVVGLHAQTDCANEGK